MTIEADGQARAVTPGGDPVLTAKFLVPTTTASLLDRPRLLDRLDEAVCDPLTLISAPAGAGKTVLASAWAASGRAPGPVAWLTLDAEDDHPGIFWTYVIWALAAGGVAMADVPIPGEADAVDHSLLVRLAASLSEARAPVVLILDRAEHLTSAGIPDALDFLLTHAARRFRLV